MNKIFILILLFVSLTITAKAEEVSCGYPELDTNIMTSEKSCGEINDDGLLTLKKAILPKINWSRYGLECVVVYDSKNQDGWYIVNQSGLGRISSFWTDNCCAPFEEGLAVGTSNGKVIFYNQILEVVKRTDYVWASGFDDGFCKVCIGDLKKEKDAYGDHDIYKGGMCGYIGNNFKVIVQIKYPYEKTPKPKTP